MEFGKLLLGTHEAEVVLQTVTGSPEAYRGRECVTPGMAGRMLHTTHPGGSVYSLAKTGFFHFRTLFAVPLPFP